MPKPHLAAVALGSNLGDRSAHMARALAAMSGLKRTALVARSDAIQTAAVGEAGGVDPGGAYLNAAAVLRTGLTPRAFLEELQRIERVCGRDRSAEAARWGPRTLDLDLILFDNRVIDEPGLTIPHPRMHERRFVLEPLAQIAGDWVVPTIGRSVAELLASCPLKPECPGPR